VAGEPSEQTFTEADFLGLARNDMGQIVPGLADRPRDRAFDRQGGARACHHIERRMDDQRRALDLMQSAARFESDAGIDEARVGGVAPVQFSLAAVRAEQLRVLFVVVLGREGEQRDDFLEGKKTGIAMDIAKHFELIAKE